MKYNILIMKNAQNSAGLVIIIIIISTIVGFIKYDFSFPTID